MRASKENAVRAALYLRALADALPSPVREFHEEKIVFLEGFVEASRRKLPMERSYDKDKNDRPER